MEYYIVEKFEYVDDEIVYTSLGYLNSKDDAIVINNSGYNDLMGWLIEYEFDRETQIKFLVDCPYLPCYGVRSSTNNIDGTNLTLIADINNPEGL
jgi:hypothetical protein